jgi:hypothetical protein
LVDKKLIAQVPINKIMSQEKRCLKMAKGCGKKTKETEKKKK